MSKEKGSQPPQGMNQKLLESFMKDKDHIVPVALLGLTPEMLEGLYSQAYRLYNTGKYREAMEQFELLVMVTPKEPKYTLGIAACLHMLKEYKSAVDAYAMCAFLDPTNPIPHYHSSDCYLKMNDKLSACVALEMALKRSQSSEFESLKERCLMTLESLKKSMRKK